MSTDLLRFVTQNRHPPYGHRSGVLQAAYRLRRQNALAESDRIELQNLLDWFKESLAIPARFTASRYPRAQETAISWVRASAHEHVARLRRLSEIVRSSGIAVEELRTKRPGYVVYEDEHRVVALPFADTPN
jgi:hypothetical protein